MSTSFLDPNTKIVNEKFRSIFYNKGDTFAFSVLRMAYIHSNFLSKKFWASSALNILRIVSTNFLKKVFLVTRINNESSHSTIVKAYVNKIIEKYFAVVRKCVNIAKAFTELIKLWESNHAIIVCFLLCYLLLLFL